MSLEKKLEPFLGMGSPLYYTLHNVEPVFVSTERSGDKDQFEYGKVTSADGKKEKSATHFDIFEGHQDGKKFVTNTSLHTILKEKNRVTLGGNELSVEHDDHFRKGNPHIFYLGSNEVVNLSRAPNLPRAVGMYLLNLISGKEMTADHFAKYAEELFGNIDPLKRVFQSLNRQSFAESNMFRLMKTLVPEERLGRLDATFQRLKGNQQEEVYLVPVKKEKIPDDPIYPSRTKEAEFLVSNIDKLIQSGFRRHLVDLSIDMAQKLEGRTWHFLDDSINMLQAQYSVEPVGGLDIPNISTGNLYQDVTQAENILSWIHNSPFLQEKSGDYKETFDSVKVIKQVGDNIIKEDTFRKVPFERISGKDTIDRDSISQAVLEEANEFLSTATRLSYEGKEDKSQIQELAALVRYDRGGISTGETSLYLADILEVSSNLRGSENWPQGATIEDKLEEIMPRVLEIRNSLTNLGLEFTHEMTTAALMADELTSLEYSERIISAYASLVDALRGGDLEKASENLKSEMKNFLGEVQEVKYVNPILEPDHYESVRKALKDFSHLHIDSYSIRKAANGGKPIVKNMIDTYEQMRDKANLFKERIQPGLAQINHIIQSASQIHMLQDNEAARTVVYAMNEHYRRSGREIRIS